MTNFTNDPINFLSANEGQLELHTKEGLTYMTDKVETIAKILTNHGVPVSVNTSSSMDFADEYGFANWNGAQKLWASALELLGYSVE